MTLVTTPAASNADSYADLATFVAFCAAVGFALGSFDNAAQEVALRKATQYLDATYNDAWIGFKSSKAQSLCWPRLATAANTATLEVLYDPDGFQILSSEIPRPVINSTCAAAVQILDGRDLMPVLDRGGQIASESVTAGPVSTQTTYANGAPVMAKIPAIEGALKGYILGGAGSGTGKLVRG